MFPSIIVRAYNEEAHLGRLLEGILQQTIKDVEIILVDSGSTDGTLAVARRYPVRIVSIPPEEFTFGRSLNRGLQAATGDLAVIASAHVYPVYPDWLERLLQPFSDPQVALVYGRQSSVSHFSERRVWAGWFPPESNPRQFHPFCNNANAAVRRRLWEQNPYDETLTGLEDLAWAKWAIDQGRCLAYSAEAEIVHVHAETPRKIYNRFRREAIAFKRIFPHEKFGMGKFLKLSVSNIAGDLWQAALERQLGPNWRSIFWYRIIQFWGAYQGYRYGGPVTRQLIQRFYYPGKLPAADQALRPVEPIRYNEIQE